MVVVSKSVEDKIYNLIYTLYQKEYFGSMEASESYCMKIYTAMLDIQSVKLKRKGEYFVRFEEEEDILVEKQIITIITKKDIVLF